MSNDGRLREYAGTVRSGGNSAMDDSDASFILEGPTQFSSGEGSAYALTSSYRKGLAASGVGKAKRTHIVQEGRGEDRPAQDRGRVSPTVDKRYDQKCFIVNHQERPESRLSIQEEGQSLRSGLLFNDEYSYCLSESPHFVTEDVQPVITPDFGQKDQNKKDRIGSQTGAMFTVDGTSQHGVTDGRRIRKLTPKECWRLQGFPDWAFDAAEEENSNTQLYKQAGNAVTVNVIRDIGDQLAEVKS